MSDSCIRGFGFYRLRPEFENPAHGRVLSAAVNHFAWCMGRYDGAMAQDFAGRLRAFWHQVPETCAGIRRPEFEEFEAYAVDHIRPLAVNMWCADDVFVELCETGPMLAAGHAQPRHVVAQVLVAHRLFKPFVESAWTYSWASTSQVPRHDGCSGGHVAWNASRILWAEGDAKASLRALQHPDFGRAVRRLADRLHFDEDSSRDRRLELLLGMILEKHPQAELLVFDKLRQWAEEDGESE